MIDQVGLDAQWTGPSTLLKLVFVGGRWALNDAQDTSVLGGSSLDWRTGEVLLLLEAERRVGSCWSLEARGRWFANTSPRSFAHALRNDGHLSISLTRYF